LFYGRNSPARILTSDAVYFGNKKIYHTLYSDVETAVNQGYDCMKLIMFCDRPAEEIRESVQIIAKTVNEAEKHGMPVMVEPLTFEIIRDKSKFDQIISDGARIAYELGADILKLPFPDDKKTIESWVDNYNIPIIMLGGSINGEINNLIRKVDE